MRALNVPNNPKLATVPVLESRVPKPDELVVLSKPLLNATIKTGELLRDSPTKWAFAGDIGEILFGVNVRPDHLTILTNRDGCDEIFKRLTRFQTETPSTIEERLERSAEIDPKPQPVSIRSYRSRFEVEGQRLDVRGDLQIKVGEWEWGDPLDYEPQYVYVVNIKVPVVPLELKMELYMGLGWFDKVKKINVAMAQKHHKIA